MTTDANPEVATEVSMMFRPRGGRTVMVRPDGSRAVPQRQATTDNTMVKLLARAFRWHRMLYSGDFTTIDELAKREKINPSYVSRVMRLAYLSPQIVDTILDGRQPARLTMKDLLEPFPMDWREQERHFDWRGP
jgi:hypothetical protein